MLITPISAPRCLRIGCDLEQGLRAGGEQQIVEQTRVLQGQHVEFVRHSEHDMEVAGGQEFAFAGRQPALARLRLALGAVPISARVVRDGLMTAARAGIAMPAERSGATAQNGTKGFELLKAKARIDTDPGSDRPAREGCRPPRRWAESFFVVSFKAAADVLGAGECKTIQRIGHGLQVPLRQMQVLGGGLQIAVPEQNLDGAQVGARLQQVGRPTVAQRVRGDAFADAGSTCGLAACDPDGLVRNRLIQSGWPRCAWETGRASASASASTRAAFPAGLG